MKQHGLFDETQESPPLATIPVKPSVLPQDDSSVHGASISQDRKSPPVASPERSAYLDLEQFVAGW